MKVTYLKEWSLCGKYPYCEYLFKSVETKEKLHGIFDKITAHVPGSVFDDLLRAGLIQDPYFEQQSLQSEWVSNRWWTYTTEFTAEDKAGERTFLCFDGIDNLAQIYLNDQFLLRLEGANNPTKIEVTGKLCGRNTVKVVIEAEPLEMGQIGLTSRINSQKPRFGYKWDFSRRLVNMGIYGAAYVYRTGEARIDDVQIDYTVKEGNVFGQVKLGLDVSRKGVYECVLTVSEQGKAIVSTRKFVHCGRYKKAILPFSIQDAKIWHPNGYGEQPQYEIRAEVIQGGQISDCYQTECGFRTVRMVANEGAPKGALPYTCEVNGKKVYLRGYNFLPLDMMYGVDISERLQKLLDLLKESNVNILRIWGGGLIGSKELFAECAKRGIMIWQDFIQSGSGYDSKPNTDKVYLKKLATVSEKAVKSLRNTTSLIIWGGGNELYDDAGKPVKYANKNIKLLRKIVKKYDSGRMFYPASPSGPNSFYDRTHRGRSHDVHGYYKYIMEKDIWHNRLHNESDTLLNSEYSIDAVSCRRTLASMLKPENMIVTDSLRNLTWRHLGDWWNTLDRDESVFGKIETLNDYILASQYIQAEGLRYETEANRRRAFENSGSIIWQANEPCPNVAATTVIDYYNRPKMAYYAVKAAFAPILASVRYDHFIIEQDKIDLSFYVTNDTNEEVEYRFEIYKDDRLAEEFSGICKVYGGRSECVRKMNLIADCKEGIRIEAEAGGYRNKILLLKKENGKCSLSFVKRCLAEAEEIIS